LESWASGVGQTENSAPMRSCRRWFPSRERPEKYRETSKKLPKGPRKNIQGGVNRVVSSEKRSYLKGKEEERVFRVLFGRPKDCFSKKTLNHTGLGK